MNSHLPIVRALFATLLLLEAAACAAGPTSQPAEEFRTIRVTIKDKPFTLEVADTEAKRAQGLMNRKTLAADAG
jgi:hypothetical protein